MNMGVPLNARAQTAAGPARGRRRRAFAPARRGSGHGQRLAGAARRTRRFERRLRPVADTELREQPPDVRLDRVHRQVQLLGDLAVAHPECDQREHLVLSHRQIGRGACSRPRLTTSRPTRSPLRDAFEGIHQFACTVRLQDHTRHADPRRPPRGTRRAHPMCTAPRDGRSWLDDHLLRPLERMTPPGERVVQRDVSMFARLAARFELDDADPVGILRRALRPGHGR